VNSSKVGHETWRNRARSVRRRSWRSHDRDRASGHRSLRGHNDAAHDARIVVRGVHVDTVERE